MQLFMGSFSPLGLYVHVPFCASACSFCAFYQEKPKRSLLDNYLKGIEQELGRLKLNRPISTIFFGGGTPALLPAEDLLRLGNAVLKLIDRQYLLEWTVEAAPSVIKRDKLEALKSLGVNRLSIGVQSFQPHLLEALGRRHGPDQVYQAYDWAREAGFENINLDLMFALPGQTFDLWKTDLLTAIQLNPEHISTYCLTFEEDTALYLKLMRGETQKRTSDEEADYYLNTWDTLEKNGYQQYEIANFAKPGKACLHNVNTWAMHEWVGVGPSAASQYLNRRYQNIASIDEWLSGLEKNVLKYVDDQNLTEKMIWVDRLIFGLRMNPGIDWLLLKSLQIGDPCIQPLEDLWNDLINNDLLHFNKPYLQLTASGRLMADAIAEKILEKIDSP